MLFCLSYVFLPEGRCTSYYRHDVEVPLLKAEFEDEKWFEEVECSDYQNDWIKEVLL